MLDKLAGIENRYEEINRLLLEVGADYQRAAELNKERIDLEAIVEKSKEYRDHDIRTGPGVASTGRIRDP
jgi:peptide chain release factor 1